jgi:hypothetical protein
MNELILIKRIKKHHTRQCLEFLEHNGTETPHFYKYAFNNSKRLFIYIDTETSNITGIIGFIHDIAIVKHVATPRRLILNIQFVYSTNANLFHKILDDITSYALDHDQSIIQFNHFNLYENILIAHGYELNEYYTCYYCSIYTFTDNYHIYFKDIVDRHTARKIYDKLYYKYKECIESD